MAFDNVVRQTLIKGSSTGLDKTTNELKAMAAAQEGVSKASLSMQSRLDSLQKSLDAEYRAEQKLAQIEKTLDAACAQGLVSVQRQNELLALASKRYTEVGETKLLSAARKDGIALSPAQLKQIDDQSHAYAKAAAQLEQMTQLYDLGKSATEDFFSTFKSDAEAGKGALESFGDAASKVLDDIADKALQMAADGIWDMIFNGLTAGASGGGSGGTGSILSSILGFFTGAGHNAGGTDNWKGGWSWVGEQGPELLNLPAGTGVKSASQSGAMTGRAANAAANTNSSGGMVVHNHIDARGARQGVGVKIANAMSSWERQSLPAAMERYNRNPHHRG